MAWRGGQAYGQLVHAHRAVEWIGYRRRLVDREGSGLMGKADTGTLALFDK
jgi:hypothetical protein